MKLVIQPSGQTLEFHKIKPGEVYRYPDGNTWFMKLEQESDGHIDIATGKRYICPKPETVVIVCDAFITISGNK